MGILQSIFGSGENKSKGPSPLPLLDSPELTRLIDDRLQKATAPLHEKVDEALKVAQKGTSILEEFKTNARRAEENNHSPPPLFSIEDMGDMEVERDFVISQKLETAALKFNERFKQFDIEAKTEVLENQENWLVQITSKIEETEAAQGFKTQHVHSLIESTRSVIVIHKDEDVLLRNPGEPYAIRRVPGNTHYEMTKPVLLGNEDIDNTTLNKASRDIAERLLYSLSVEDQKKYRSGLPSLRAGQGILQMPENDPKI